MEEESDLIESPLWGVRLPYRTGLTQSLPVFKICLLAYRIDHNRKRIETSAFLDSSGDGFRGESRSHRVNNYTIDVLFQERLYGSGTVGDGSEPKVVCLQTLDDLVPLPSLWFYYE